MAKKYRVNVNDKAVTVEVTKQRGSTLSFVANGEQYDVDVQPIIEEFSSVPNSTHPPRQTHSQQAPTKKAQKGSTAPGSIVAPMPGIIVSIAVKEGDSVKAGMTLCVMEAMKMENNIAATQDGTIAKIHATVGKEVENGQLLFDIKPN